MWGLTITNNYEYPIVIEGETIEKGKTFKPEREFGSTYIEVPGIGQLNFIDLDKKKMGNPSKKALGVFMSYQGNESVYNYDGVGEINVTINFLGQAELTAEGDLELMRFKSFVFPKEAVEDK